MYPYLCVQVFGEVLTLEEAAASMAAHRELVRRQCGAEATHILIEAARMGKDSIPAISLIFDQQKYTAYLDDTIKATSTS
jgi:hypothetical protein